MHLLRCLLPPSPPQCCFPDSVHLIIYFFSLCVGVTFAPEAIAAAILRATRTSHIIYSWHNTHLEKRFECILSTVTLEQFTEFVRQQFGADAHSYSVKSFEDWENRDRIDTLDELKRALDDFNRKIVVYKQRGTPDKPPEDDVSALTWASSHSQSRGSKSGSGGRGSEQTEFSLTVRDLDADKCVICSADGSDSAICLQAAHIIDVSTPNVRQVCRDNGLAGAYDARNGLTMCFDCHRAFDSHRCCVGADLTVLVSSALTSIPRYKTKWNQLARKKIELVREGSHRPPLATLEYRVKQYREKTKLRQEFARQNPCVCELCGHRVKTPGGLKLHLNHSSRCAGTIGRGYAAVHTPAVTPASSARKGGVKSSGPDLVERFGQCSVSATGVSTPLLQQRRAQG